MNDSVYVVIANEEEWVKECIVLSNLPKAQEIFGHLKNVWGSANVALVNVRVDNIPFIVASQLTNHSSGIGNLRDCEGCKHTQLFCSSCLRKLRQSA